MDRSRRLILATLLVLCVVGRGAYVVYLVHADAVVTSTGDAPSYLGPARELVEHRRFTTPSQPDKPEFLRTPGYPLFIAAVFRVFGQRIAAVLLAQVLLSALTVLLAYVLASRMWSAPIGLLAALLTAVEPLQTVTTATLLTECVSALLLMTLATVGFAVFTDAKPRLRVLALFGLIMAITTLVRPVVYYLPAFVLVLLLVRYVRRRAGWAHLAKMTAAFLAPIVVLVGGWQFRNHERVDSWRISGIEGKNLYKYRAAGVVARESHISLIEAQHELTQKFGPLGTESQGSYYARMYRAGMHILTAHPVDAIIGIRDGLWSQLFSVHPVSGAIEGTAEVLLLASYALCICGLVIVVRRRKDLIAHVFVVGIAAYVLLVSAGPEAVGGRGARFRAPIMPILILYAALATYAVYSRVRATGLAASRLPDVDPGTTTPSSGSQWRPIRRRR